jgi:integrase
MHSLPQRKLTKRVVDSIRPDPSGKDRFIWDTGDGSVKGFGIRMKPSGAAAYLIQYRNKEGRTRRLAVGKVGVLAPDEAREIAAEKLKEVSKGGDPSAERHAIRKGLTVTELCELYVKDAKGRIKDSTWEHDQGRINCHILPLLGQHKVAGLTLRDIEKLQTDIAAGKTAKARKEKGRSGRISGGQGVAARTVGMFSTILEFARRNGVIKDNPARGVKKYADKKRERFLSLKEITAFGEAMRKCEAQRENHTGLAAMRALLLTGCRRGEILGLPREWLDAKAGCIRFGDTKTGAQIRPIGKAAAKFLASRPKHELKDENGETTISPWIFPADRGKGHFIGLPRVLNRVCEEAELKNVTIHTLRHTFASVAAELGYNELTIAGLLGHGVHGITNRYSHLPDSALLSAANTVSARVETALKGKKQKTNAADRKK